MDTMKTKHLWMISLLTLTLWGCPEDPKTETPSDMMDMETSAGETSFADMNPNAGSTVDMGEQDMDLVEPDSCEADVECFPGRICLEGSCADAECQDDSDCSAERPVCFGEEGEEPGQRRGRCGDCAADNDCYGQASCVPFPNTGDEESTEGTCQLEGSCEGSLECSPSSTLVIRGPQSEVCLDRRTSERDPLCESAFNCQEGDTCPTGLRCLESGQCATTPINEECDENIECGYGEVCRDDKLCGPCQEDRDCGNDAQVCRSGRCLEVLGACQEDTDCIGARRCVLNECSSNECEEDFFAGNQSFESAVEIDGDRAYRGLSSCADDWYSFTLAPSMSALVKVRQRDRGANLGLVIVDDEQREIGRSVGSAPIEAVRLRESAAPRIVFVRVFQEGEPAVAEYDLEISYTPSGVACLDDPFELNGGDDTIETARLVRYDSADTFPNQTQGQVCVGDADYLCFEMARGELLTIKGEVDLGDALIIGTLLDPQGGMIGEGRWAVDQNPINIDQEVEQNGRYCLALNSDDEGGRRTGQGRYTLVMNGVSPDLAELCGESLILTQNDGRGGDSGTLEGSDTLRASCAPDSDGPEQVYTINITEPSLVIATVAGSSAGTLGDPVISLRAQCDQENSEIACSARSYNTSTPYLIPPNPAVLRAPVTPPIDPVTGEGIGQYSIILDGNRVGDDPRYQLDVELRPLASPPVNEDCNRVTELSFDEGVSVANVSLDQASSDLDSCSEGGPDATYTFTIDQDSEVLIQVTSKPAEFPVVVSLSDRCGGPSIACGFGVEEVLAAGTYHLTVAGADSASRGLVELQVSAAPLPQGVNNDICADSEALEGASGSVESSTAGANNDYELAPNNLCTRYNSNAGDLVYRYSATAGQAVTFTATPVEGWDLSLYIVSDCDGDIEDSCLAGHDEALAESITYTPTVTGDLYVIVDGANEEFGPFTLTWTPAE